MPIMNRCLGFSQISFTSFFLVNPSVAPTRKKRNLTWVNMRLGNSLTFSPYIFLLRFPRHQNFGREKEGAFPSPKY